ncbi:hypothetical protein [Microlunatus ginsengisoli]
MTQSGARRKVVRWTLWLSAGVVLGLIVGFAVGLGRPRPQTPRIRTV